MKRRSSVHRKDPPTIRNFSSSAVIDGVQPSHNRFDTTTSVEDADMNVLKRVKFRDPGTSKPPNFKPDISSIQNEATQSPRSNLPKTSEYAFFKKVKKNARGHSYPLRKNDNRLKDGELTECTKEILNKAKQSYEELTPSLPVKKSKPINHESFFSPTVGISKNQAVTNMVNPTSKAIRSPLFVKKVKPTSDYFSSSPFSGGLKKEGNQYSNRGVFSTRRQRLRCWVSTALPELDESFPEGVDLVDVLLSRLFPEENENNYRLDPNSRQVQIDTKHQLPSSASDTHVKGLNWTCTRNSIGSGNGSYSDYGFFRYGTDRPRDIDLLELDTLVSDYPSTSYTKKTHCQYKYSKPFIESSCPDVDPFYGSPYPKYRSITCHLKELDEFHEPNTPVLRGEPRKLLLGWDFNNEKEEQDPPIMSNNTDMNLVSALTTSWGNYHPQNVHDKLNASTLGSSSLFSNNSLYPLLDFPPDHHFRRDLLDEKYQIPQSPKYLELVEEDCIRYCAPECSSIVLSPQDHTWYMNRVYGENEPILPHGLDFGLGSKCLSMMDLDSLTEHYSSNHHDFQFPHNESCLYNSDHAYEVFEGMLNPNDWPMPIINFQIPCDVEICPISCPLLLDNSNWTQSKEEIYCDGDDDDEWKYS